MKKKIEITVWYDNANVGREKDLEENLRDSLTRVIGEGLLSPTTTEIVDDWKIQIT